MFIIPVLAFILAIWLVLLLQSRDYISESAAIILGAILAPIFAIGSLMVLVLLGLVK